MNIYLDTSVLKEKKIEYVFEQDTHLYGVLIVRESTSLALHYTMRADTTMHAKLLVIILPNSSFTLTTIQHHEFERSASSMMVRAIVFEQSNFHYDSMITIGSKAFHTNAVQEAHIVTMNESSRATASPAIEIKNNDVQCKHGSAIAYFDADEVFYTRSRGLSLHQTEHLLLHGMANAILEECDEQKKAEFFKLINEVVKK